METDERCVNVLRVAVANNFNFTQKELEALDDLSWDKDRLFVNSNSFVRVTADYPSFLTVNPYLDTFVEPKGDLSKVRACRVKVVYLESVIFPDAPVLSESVTDAIHWCDKHNIPVLITFMRFSSKETLLQYTIRGEGHYEHRGGWWRLKQESKDRLVQVIKNYCDVDEIPYSLIHYCDLKEEGCPACGNCAKLAFPDIKSTCKVFGINLCASGDNGRCIFNCPDCWAKRLQKSGRCVSMDKISQNSKQKGHK